MRLAIVGKTRSGKSTAIHRFLSHALRHPWAGVILLDGKGSELSHYAGLPGVVYHGVEDLEAWATVLETHVQRMGQRYQALIARTLRVAPAEDPRYLLVIDEVQKGTRATKGLGKRIGDALTLICEQSAALGDVVVVATQERSTPCRRRRASTSAPGCACWVRDFTTCRPMANPPSLVARAT